MIKQEVYEGGLIRTYSDAGVRILQNETGIIFDDALDIPDRYTYTETNIPIEQELTPEEALNILLGGDADEEN